MTNRTRLLAAYAIIVGIAAFVLESRIQAIGGHSFCGWRNGEPFGAYTASRELPCNHRLAEEDFMMPASMPSAFSIYLPELRNLTGRYLRRTIARSATINWDTLDTKPVIRPVPNGKVVAVPLAEQPEAMHWLDAGGAVRILLSGASVPAEVIFVNCGNLADPKSCIATLVTPAGSALPGEAAKWRLTPEPGTRGWNQCP